MIQEEEERGVVQRGVGGPWGPTNENFVLFFFPFCFSVLTSWTTCSASSPFLLGLTLLYTAIVFHRLELLARQWLPFKNRHLFHFFFVLF